MADELETGFKRILFGVPRGLTNEPAARLAAEFAQLLNVELFGLFVEDVSGRALGELSFVRELLTLESRWSPIDTARLAEQGELAARRACRQFREAVRSVHPNLRFEIVRGDPAVALAAGTAAGDIVILAEPEYGGLFSQSWEELTEAAFTARASVMLVPNRVLSQRGPVIAIAKRPEEAGLKTALAIASLARSELVIVDVGEGEFDRQEIIAGARESGISIQIVRSSASTLTTGAMPVSGMDRAKERVVVLSRGTLLQTDAQAIAFRRRTPVLITNVG